MDTVFEYSAGKEMENTMEIKWVMPQNRDVFLRENREFLAKADIDYMPVASSDYVIYATENGEIQGILQAYERDMVFYVHRFYVGFENETSDVADALFENLHILAEELSVKTIVALFAAEESEEENQFHFFEKYGFSEPSRKMSYFVADAGETKVGPLYQLSDPDTDIGINVPLLGFSESEYGKESITEIVRMEKDAQLLSEYTKDSAVIVDLRRARAAIMTYRISEKAPLQILDMELIKKDDVAYLCELLYRIVAATDGQILFPSDSPEKARLFTGLLKGCHYKELHVYTVSKTLYSLDYQPIKGYSEALIRLQALSEYLLIRSIESSLFLREGLLPYLRFEQGDSFVECQYYPKEGEGDDVGGFTIWSGIRPKNSPEKESSYLKVQLWDEGLAFNPDVTWENGIAVLFADHE